MHNYLFDVEILVKCLVENLDNKVGFHYSIPLGSSLRYLNLSHNFLGTHNDDVLAHLILYNRSLSYISLT